MSPEGSGPRADGKPSAEAAGCPQGRMCSASSLQNSGPGPVPQGMRTLLHWAGRRLALRPRGGRGVGSPDSGRGALLGTAVGGRIRPSLQAW